MKYHTHHVLNEALHSYRNCRRATAKIQDGVEQAWTGVVKASLLVGSKASATATGPLYGCYAEPSISAFATQGGQEQQYYCKATALAGAHALGLLETMFP